MNLVNGDDESCALCVQQAQKFVPGPAPVSGPFRGEVRCQSEPGCGEGCDFPGRRSVPELLDETKHVIANPGQETRGGCSGNDGPTVSPGDPFGRAQHDCLADASGPRDDGQKPWRA